MPAEAQLPPARPGTRPIGIVRPTGLVLRRWGIPIPDVVPAPRQPSTPAWLAELPVLYPNGPPPWAIPARPAPPPQQPATPLVPRIGRQAANRHVTTVLRATLDVIGGVRSVRQLEGLATRKVLTRIPALRTQVTGRLEGRLLGTTHTWLDVPDVIDACGTFRQGARLRALTARFEYQDGAWVCAFLAFL